MLYADEAAMTLFIKIEAASLHYVRGAVHFPLSSVGRVWQLKLGSTISICTFLSFLFSFFRS